jgi:small-conductance mechanosensitive channel
MFQEALNNIVDRVSGSAFDLASAAVIGLFGWYFAYTIGNKAAEFFARTKLNHTIKHLGWEEPIGRIWRGGSLARVFGKVVEIWILLFFLMVSAGILQLAQLSQILSAVVMYFFNIFIAFLIFAVAVFLADFSQRTLVANLEKEKFVYSHFLSKCVSGTIWTLAVLAILYQLKIIAPLVLAIFVGIVVTISIAVGVALGLGGKDLAAKILKEIEERLK